MFSSVATDFGSWTINIIKQAKTRKVFLKQKQMPILKITKEDHSSNKLNGVTVLVLCILSEMTLGIST